MDIPPIFNPYDKLYWAAGFGYVPPPSDPFPPVSPPQLAVYRVTSDTDVDASPDAGDESVGEFGAGPRASDSAYWIDAFSVCVTFLFHQRFDGLPLVSVSSLQDTADFALCSGIPRMQQRWTRGLHDYHQRLCQCFFNS